MDLAEPPEFKAYRVEAPPEPVAVASAPPRREPSWGWDEPWSFEPPKARPRTRGSEMPARSSGRRIKPLPPAIAATVIAGLIGAWVSSPAHKRPSIVNAPAAAQQVRLSAYARRAIPPQYARIYTSVARKYGLDWAVLAAVGQIESDHGRSPSVGVARGTNHAGAAGPAQFLSTTWARYGVDADGAGSANPYDPIDAITAMAAYLKASGAPEDWRGALYGYDHSSGYVDSVLALSRRLRGA
jgi:hypothetical protein